MPVEGIRFLLGTLLKRIKKKTLKEGWKSRHLYVPLI